MHYRILASCRKNKLCKQQSYTKMPHKGLASCRNKKAPTVTLQRSFCIQDVLKRVSSCQSFCFLALTISAWRRFKDFFRKTVSQLLTHNAVSRTEPAPPVMLNTLFDLRICLNSHLQGSGPLLLPSLPGPLLCGGSQDQDLHCAQVWNSTALHCLTDPV